MTQPPKRRLLQFSLRGLVVFCAVACVWIGIWINRAREQREVVQWIEKQGGNVIYENETKGVFPLATQSTISYIPLPRVWKSWLGKDLEWDVVYVDLTGTEVSDLFPLKTLDNLQALHLESTKVTDLSPIRNLNALILLNIQLTNVTDIQTIKKLKNLEYLFLYETNLTQSQLGEIKEGLPHCKVKYNFE